MVANVASGLDFFRQVLELREYRQQILTADIANASTPNFKGVDLDFHQALTAASGDAGGPPSAVPQPAVPVMLVDDPRDLAAQGGVGNSVASTGMAIKYQAGTTVTLDGNSVDLNREKSEAAANAVQYEAAASFTSQLIKMMNVAIGGAAGAAAAGGG